MVHCNIMFIEDENEMFHQFRRQSYSRDYFSKHLLFFVVTLEIAKFTLTLICETIAANFYLGDLMEKI